MFLHPKNSAKKIVNFLIIASIGLGIFKLIGQKDYLHFIALAFFAPFFLLLPRLAIKKWLPEGDNGSLARLLEGTGAAIFIINVSGSLYLYNFRIEYDSFAHFAVLALSAPFAAFILSNFFKESFKNDFFNLSLAVFLILVFLGVSWEVIEWGSDQIFGTNLFFGFWQPTLIDTIYDLIFGVLGAFSGSLFIFFNWHSWYGGLRDN